MDESRSDSEKMDKKEKSDEYDSPSDLWSVFLLKKYLRQRRRRTRGSKSFLEWSESFQSPSGSGVCVPSHQAFWSLSLVLPSQSLCCVLIVVSVNIVNSKDYKTPFLFPLLFRRR